MRKLLLLLSVSLLGSFAYTEEASGLKKISDHVYAYVGAVNATPSTSFGANAGVIIGKDAVLVVDTLVSAKAADKFLKDIKKITSLPVKYVVNTHYHLDHAWGNCVFVEKGAVVIGHESSRLSMATTEDPTLHPETFGLTAEEIKGTVLKAPTITFKEYLQVDLGGGVLVDLYFPGESHTKGSIVVGIPGEDVLFLGDLLFTQYHPFIAEGNFKTWINVLSSLETTSYKFLIPGHGPLSSVQDLKDMKIYITEFDSKAKKLCKGRKPEDLSDIAGLMLKVLPDQKRTEMTGLIQMNLSMRYLKSPESKK